MRPPARQSRPGVRATVPAIPVRLPPAVWPAQAGAPARQRTGAVPRCRPLTPVPMPQPPGTPLLLRAVQRAMPCWTHWRVRQRYRSMAARCRLTRQLNRMGRALARQGLRRRLQPMLERRWRQTLRVRSRMKSRMKSRLKRRLRWTLPSPAYRMQRWRVRLVGLPSSPAVAPDATPPAAGSPAARVAGQAALAVLPQGVRAAAPRRRPSSRQAPFPVRTGLSRPTAARSCRRPVAVFLPPLWQPPS